MNVNDFGKDLCLMHEMVITGRKAGVDPSCYTLLAQSEEWFRRVAGLCSHLHILQRTKTLVAAVSPDALEPLIATVAMVTKSGEMDCVYCGFSTRHMVAHLYVPTDVLEKDARKREALPEAEREKKRSEQNAEYAAYFHNNLVGDGVRKVGMHPAELTLLLPYTCDENGYLHTYNTCWKSDRFAQGIRRLVAQRNLLAQMSQM